MMFSPGCCVLKPATHSGSSGSAELSATIRRLPVSFWPGVYSVYAAWACASADMPPAAKANHSFVKFMNGGVDEASGAAIAGCRKRKLGCRLRLEQSGTAWNLRAQLVAHRQRARVEIRRLVFIEPQANGA